MHCPDCERVAGSRIKSDYKCPISLPIRLLFDVLKFVKKRQRKGKLEKLELRNLIVFFFLEQSASQWSNIKLFDGSHNHVHDKCDRNKSKAR